LFSFFDFLSEDPNIANSLDQIILLRQQTFLSWDENVVMNSEIQNAPSHRIISKPVIPFQSPTLAEGFQFSQFWVVWFLHVVISTDWSFPLIIPAFLNFSPLVLCLAIGAFDTYSEDYVARNYEDKEKYPTKILT